ncbi:hypothetical protein NDU88_003756 [Pleurodeles waltl]|uniref:Uncharacterized protein n=1 Tax=Pleurodeles waltl TaxID=8319 RepID=A0AAV7SGV2_PLEWA|nr:hypothetical protein NDU88_003756 [Pleurodeles waltl]
MYEEKICKALQLLEEAGHSDLAACIAAQECGQPPRRAAGSVMAAVWACRTDRGERRRAALGQGRDGACNISPVGSKDTVLHSEITEGRQEIELGSSGTALDREEEVVSGSEQGDMDVGSMVSGRDDKRSDRMSAGSESSGSFICSWMDQREDAGDIERQVEAWWEEFGNRSNQASGLAGTIDSGSATACINLAQLEWSEEEGMSEEEGELQFLEPKSPFKVYGKGVNGVRVQNRQTGEEVRAQLGGEVTKELGRQVCERDRSRGQLVETAGGLDQHIGQFLIYAE